MALIIDLKPGERVIVGQSVISNGGPRTRLRIDGDVPILREKDIIPLGVAVSPCQRLYVLLQAMYLDRDPARLHGEYFKLVREIQEAAPSTTQLVLKINEKIIAGSYYKALKDAQKLIAHEARLLENA